MSSNKKKHVEEIRPVQAVLYSPTGIRVKEFYFIYLYSCFTNSMNDKITT